MTAYFDTKTTAIHDTRSLAEDAALNALIALETEMVNDVTLAAELPDFPPEYADTIAKIVMQHGYASTPHEHLAEVEDAAEYRQRLTRLASDLHSVFHGVAHADGPLRDDPLHGVLRLLGNGEERRAAILRRERDALVAKHYPGGVYGIDDGDEGTGCPRVIRDGNVLVTWVTPSAMMRALRAK